MTNITLIGGSGFVGTRLIELLKDEYQIRNIDKRESHFHNDITVTGDVRDQTSVSRHLAGADLVVLLAAEHRDDVSPVSLYYDVNVGGMRNVLEAMETNGVKTDRFYQFGRRVRTQQKESGRESPGRSFQPLRQKQMAGGTGPSAMV